MSLLIYNITLSLSHAILNTGRCSGGEDDVIVPRVRVEMSEDQTSRLLHHLAILRGAVRVPRQPAHQLVSHSINLRLAVRGPGTSDPAGGETSRLERTLLTWREGERREERGERREERPT